MKRLQLLDLYISIDIDVKRFKSIKCFYDLGAIVDLRVQSGRMECFLISEKYNVGSRIIY